MITINRIYGKDGTYGTLIAKRNGSIIFITNTIELAWRDNKRNISCIPEGKYQCVPYKSSHLGHTFLVKDVPNRSGILLHPANFVAGKNVDLRGCIAPVSYIKDINGDTYLDGANSVVVMRILLSLYPEGFELSIKKSKDV